MKAGDQKLLRALQDQKLSKTNKYLNLESSPRLSTLFSSPPVQLPPVSQVKPLPWNLILFGVKITKRPATSSQSFFFPIQYLSSPCFQPPHISCQDPPEMSGHTPSHSPTVPPIPFNRFLFMLESVKMSTLTPLPKLKPPFPLRRSPLLMSLPTGPPTPNTMRAFPPLLPLPQPLA